jgi:O-succinylbenzoic acid--CoA ligase
LAGAALQLLKELHCALKKIFFSRCKARASMRFSLKDHLASFNALDFWQQDDRRVTYGELILMVNEASAMLRDRGVAEGAIVALYGLSKFDTIIIFLACLVNRQVLLPLNHREAREEIWREARFHTGVQVLITPNASESELGPQPEDCIARHHLGRRGFGWNMLFFKPRFAQNQQRCAVEMSQLMSLPDEAALIIFTSGSSGERKGVVHSFSSLYYSALGSIEFYGMNRNDRSMLSLPLFHIGGIMIIVRALLCGATLINARDESLSPEDISASGTTILSLVPTQLHRILGVLRHYGEGKDRTLQFKALRVVLVGAGAVTKDQLMKASEYGMPLSVTYGSSETCAQLTATSPGQNRSDPSFIGEVLPYREVEIEGGSLLIKGKTLFMGYLAKGRFFTPFDENGWFHAPDKISYDPQRRGYEFRGRSDDVVKIAGENISLGEIERACGECVSLDMLFKVFAVFHAEYGMSPVLLLMGGDRPDPIKLKNQLEQRLTGLKRPAAVYWASGTEQNGYKLTPGECQRIIDHPRTDRLL